MLLALVAAALAGTTAGLSRSFPAEGITEISLEQSGGSVQVVTDPGIGLVEALGAPTQWEEGCLVDAQQHEHRIHIEVRHSAGRKSCRVDWRLVVPPDVSLTLRLGGGGAQVTGLSGPLDIELASGDLVLEDVTGDLRARVGTGAVRGNFSGRVAAVEVATGGVHLEGMIHPLDVAVGLGNIGLTWGLAPRGQTRAITGAGSLTLLLPPATPVTLIWERTIGPRKVMLPEDDNASTRFVVGAGIGSVLVDDLASERGRKRARVRR